MRVELPGQEIDAISWLPLAQASDGLAALGAIIAAAWVVSMLYVAVQAQGYGKKGTHALMLALEHLSNINR